jgi:hypothetical protein
MTTKTDPTTAMFEFWKDWAEKTASPWLQQQPRAATQDPWQVPRQLFELWSEAWMKAMAQGATPDMFKAGQRLWMDQIEIWSEAFRQAMGTEAFAESLGQAISQTLTMTERVRANVNPQIDAALGMANLPSRQQIDRLLAHVIELDDRLNDLEAKNRQVLRELKSLTASVKAATRPAEQGETASS